MDVSQNLHERTTQFDGKPPRRQTMNSIVGNRTAALWSRVFPHYGSDDSVMFSVETVNEYLAEQLPALLYSGRTLGIVELPALEPNKIEKYRRWKQLERE